MIGISYPSTVSMETKKRQVIAHGDLYKNRLKYRHFDCSLGCINLNGGCHCIVCHSNYALHVCTCVCVSVSCDNSLIHL